jgi:hypothetical protein
MSKKSEKKSLRIKLDIKSENFIKSKADLISKKTIGVYFLKFNGAIVYVGKSNNISFRIKSHINEGVKVFNDFSFIECSENTLDSTELAYIIMYDPVFNKRDSLTKGETLEEFCVNNKVEDLLYEINIESDDCIFDFKNNTSSIKELSKYLGMSEQGVYKKRREHPKLFNLVWDGWLKKCEEENK